MVPLAMSDPVGQAALDRAFQEKDLLLVYQPIHEFEGLLGCSRRRTPGA